MEQQNKTVDKLTDKAFSRLVITSVLGIIVCIVCLCSTTFAWFSGSAPSNGNEIRMADECLLSVTVYNSGLSVLEVGNGADTEDSIELVPGVEYEVVLMLPPNTASGYCMIEANGNVYYTDYILRHSESAPQMAVFKLKAETVQTVTFTPRWGIYNRDSDVVNGVLSLP